MSRLYVPAKTAREIEKEKWAEQRARWRAVLSELFDFDDPVCQEWNPRLRDIDPLLRLGRARGRVQVPEFGWVRAGFYHWVRDNDETGAAPTISQPITTTDDQFREPDSGVLEELRQSDLRHPLVWAELMERRGRAERAEEEWLAAEREERQAEIVDRFLAATRTQVSLNRDVPWSQNHAGRRGARKA